MGKTALTMDKIIVAFVYSRWIDNKLDASLRQLHEVCCQLRLEYATKHWVPFFRKTTI